MYNIRHCGQLTESCNIFPLIYYQDIGSKKCTVVSRHCKIKLDDDNLEKEVF